MPRPWETRPQSAGAGRAPYSRDPFGAPQPSRTFGDGRGGDPFGAPARHLDPPTPPRQEWFSAPAAPPPTPAPAPAVHEPIRRREPGRRSPLVIFVANLLVGAVSAVLCSAAVATILGIPEFEYRYPDSPARMMALSLVTAIGVWAAAMTGLILLNRRGKRAGRLLSMANAVIVVAVSATTVVMRPGAEVRWFTTAVLVAAIAAAVLAAASALLLFSRPARVPFGSASVESDGAAHVPNTEITDRVQRPILTPAPADFDPFG